MSTRAIIGLLRPDGKVEAGWQWCDGKGLRPLLDKYFSTEGAIKELFSIGTWDSMCSPKADAAADFIDIAKRNRDNEVANLSSGVHVLYNIHENAKQIASGGSPRIKAVAGHLFFEDFLYALGQDINYLYLFNDIKQKWLVIPSCKYRYYSCLYEDVPREHHRAFLFM